MRRPRRRLSALLATTTFTALVTALALPSFTAQAAKAPQDAMLGVNPGVTVIPQANTDLQGWATVNGTTTGGGNANPITVTTASALISAMQSSQPAVIRVQGTIELDGMQDVASNKTIIGVGTSARIVGGGLDIDSASNIIIRNITFANFEDDAINITDGSHHIWIDHNTFTNGDDGAVDIKRGSDFITVSWNHVYNHNKTMLLGHSDSNGSQDRGHLRVTYHHNFFDGTTQRHPRVRFGNPVHVYNNYYRNNSGYGVASTCEAGVLVEANYFENVEDPTHVGEGSSPGGSLVFRNNYLVNSGAPQTSGSVASPPYFVVMDSPSSVAAIVRAGAGVGHI